MVAASLAAEQIDDAPVPHVADWLLCISGFRQSRGQSHGMHRMWLRLQSEHSRPRERRGCCWSIRRAATC